MTAETDRAGPPIFILGMLQRTGTNHLWDLFGLHPDTELLRPVFEDHLVPWSPHLLAYVADVTRSWSSDWEVPPNEGVALRHALGDAIAGWVAGHAGQRVVTKMPTVEQATNFFALMPNCPLIVLVRDGRNVSESMVGTFNMSYERVFRRWSRAADVVLELERAHGNKPHFALVRYEDLVDNPAATMRRLCETTGLDPDRYPYEQITSVPVRGSSTLRKSGSDSVHWNPVDRPAGFDPHSRWQVWTDHEHRRFNAVAGAQQRALGYDCHHVGGRDTIVEHLAVARDRSYAIYYDAKVWAGRARRSVKRVHGTI